MAFCSSSIGLHNCVYWTAKHSRENLVLDIRAFGFSRSARIGCRTFVIEMVSSGCQGSRKKCINGIRSMLIPREVDSESAGSSTVKILQDGVDVSVAKDSRVSEMSTHLELDEGGGGGNSLGGDGSNGKFPPGGGDGSGNHEEDDIEEEEFGPILKFEEVIRETEVRGVSLPSDMLEAAKTIGIRKVLLLRYLDLQDSVWPLGVAIKSCSLLRNRMLVDPSFLFKVGIEIVIDSCCATFAEIQKRGKDFWAEFELYVADLLVGVVVNVALVGLLAPYARIGQPSASKGLLGSMQRAYGALPSRLVSTLAHLLQVMQPLVQRDTIWVLCLVDLMLTWLICYIFFFIHERGMKLCTCT
ncbi:protein RETICULATA-RELATED 1, chloroplastic-like isoform X2 [Magnolia sinica]|uniref:protein RETICULATA-RELATED 1, chloroplastic-like isoform X2 n=1 Tax=Magnolia sinica TaxID=86752 RepID=UPI00265A6275|nr:protein RETICULATA-RELATED 1, chloroplastic-like isoform X2 [Magnolia sinica]